MPDRRHHRGKHPDDDRLFADTQLDSLRTTVAEYSWLLTRGYAEKSALKLVGDRHNLTVRQRTAVMRSSCSDQALHKRQSTQVKPADTAGQTLGIDGYNLLITIESALSGGMVLIGRDGCYRDLASIHGTYRKVEETIPALEIIVDHVGSMACARIDFYIDRPVSNSGRLKVILADLLEQRRMPPQSAAWNIELVDSPDTVLADYDGLVCSADSAVLDRCDKWFNLAAHIVDRRIHNSWMIDLRSPFPISERSRTW